MEKLSSTKENAKAEREGRRSNIKRVQNELYKKNNSEYKRSR